jgi:hypothetical protein
MPKAGDTCELLFSERRGGFVEHLNQTKEIQQCDQSHINDYYTFGHT